MYNYCKIEVWFRSDPGPTPRSGSLTNRTWTFKFGSGPNLSLAQTHGPVGSVQSRPRSMRARTGLRTVYPHPLAYPVAPYD